MTFNHDIFDSKNRGSLLLLKMSELLFNPVFPDVSKTFRNEAFSAVYFGRHCEKNVLVLKHDVTVMIVFGDDLQWSAPEFIKAVSFRGERRNGKKIVGNGNVVLLLDEDGNLWQLVNAFEVPDETNESLHSISKECYYEWAPFKKFNRVKVVAVSAMHQGFACVGLCRNSKTKLLVLPSLDSTVEEYRFDELNTGTNLLGYYLTNFNMNIKKPVFQDTPAQETLLISDRLSGKTYICAKNGRNSLINKCSSFLICALHFPQEDSILLCFESGKLIFCFYNKCQRECVLYLSKKLVFVGQCCCSDSCLLWSDGISLKHTKLTFCEELVKLSHLELSSPIQCPLALVKIHQHVLVVTLNNFYYCVSAGMNSAREIITPLSERLMDIYKGSCLIKELEEKNNVLAHYLQCKEIVQKDDTKGRAEIKWEGNRLSIRTHLGICLKQQLWKVQLKTSDSDKNYVHFVDLEEDLQKEGSILIENPFKTRCQVKVSLVGSFDTKVLFLYLGEVEELEKNLEKEEVRKKIEEISRKKRQFRMKDG